MLNHKDDDRYIIAYIGGYYDNLDKHCIDIRSDSKEESIELIDKLIGELKRTKENTKVK